MRVMALYLTSFFAECLRMAEDGPGRRHLCHTDTFLVFFLLTVSRRFLCCSSSLFPCRCSLKPALVGAYGASQTTVLHRKRLNQTESLIFVILCVLCFKRHFFLLLFHSTVACVVPFGGCKKSPRTSSHPFYFLWDQ